MILPLLAASLRSHLRAGWPLLVILLVPAATGPLFAAAGILLPEEVEESFAEDEAESERDPVKVPAELLPYLPERLEAVDGGELRPIATATPDGPDRWRITHERSLDARSAAVSLRRAIADRHEAAVGEALARVGAPPPDVLVRVERVRVEADEVEARSPTPSDPGRAAAAGAGLVLLIASMFTAFGLAIEELTGERERGTLETLLTAGASRARIVATKLAVLAGGTLLSGLIAVGSLALSLPALPLDRGRAVLWSVLLLPLLVLPLTALFALLAARSRSYRSASLLAAGPMLIPPFLASASFASETPPFLWLLPFAGGAIALRDALLGTLAPLPLLVASASSLGWAAVGAVVAGRWLVGEEGITGSVGRPTRLGAVLAIFATVLILFWYVGQPIQLLAFVPGVVLTQVLLFGGLGLLVPVLVGLPVQRTLSLRRPTARDLALAVPAGLGAPAIATLVLLLQAPLLPVRDQVLEAFGDAMLAPLSLGGALLVLAVLPALCEELLFRGALLGLLRDGVRPVPRALLIGALFGILHLLAFRILPTAAIGVLLSAAVIRSGSLWVGITIHLVNNALLIGLAYTVAEAGEAPPVPLLLAVGALSVGAVWAMRGRGEPAER